jgi:hypothetical protein
MKQSNTFRCIFLCVITTASYKKIKRESNNNTNNNPSIQTPTPSLVFGANKIITIMLIFVVVVVARF